ncbi:MAG TPA: ATP-binding protein [Bacillota bacterium]|nr:ATP-binding protein [Bacillota bacterium]
MKSIAHKLWAGMMLLVVIVLALLWSFQIIFLEDFYTRQRVGEVRNRARALVQDIYTLDSEELQDALEGFVYDYNCSIELLDREGRTLYSIGPGMQMPMMAHHYRRGGLLEEIMSGQDVTVTATHPRFGSSFMVIGIPISQEGEVIGALIINMPLAPVQDTAAILKKQLVYIMAALLAAALGISFLLSRSFTKPILEIISATKRMASGDFGVKLKVRSSDEIGVLSGAINHLGEELSKTEKLRRDLIANVSHELRTPLSLIRGYAETIRDITGGEKDKRDRQLGVIIEEAERLGRIVDDILDLSRMQSGSIALDTAPFDLGKVLREVTKKFDILSGKMGIKVACDSDEGLMVRADEARIEQVLFNLINNAFNYSKPSGAITVSARRKGKAVRVEVSDTGRGIPPEDLGNIWERYYKGDKSEGRKVVGTGLGLAIVKNILEAHKARFGVDSALGRGTTFWFELDAE